MSAQTREEIEAEYMAALTTAAERHNQRVVRIDAERESSWSVAMFDYWKAGERIAADHGRRLAELEEQG